jgi:hypothetical protein
MRCNFAPKQITRRDGTTLIRRVHRSSPMVEPGTFTCCHSTSPSAASRRTGNTSSPGDAVFEPRAGHGAGARRHVAAARPFNSIRFAASRNATIRLRSPASQLQLVGRPGRRAPGSRFRTVWWLRGRPSVRLDGLDGALAILLLGGALTVALRGVRHVLGAGAARLGQAVGQRGARGRRRIHLGGRGARTGDVDRCTSPPARGSRRA